jgi:hypothetical protein
MNNYEKTYITKTMDKNSIDKFFNSLSDEELKEKWNKYNKHSEQENSVTISEFIENIKQEALEELYFKNNPDRKQVVEERVNAFFEDYNKQETLEEAAESSWMNYEHVEGHLYSTSYKNGFIQGAKSDAAKDYWFEKFQQEQDKNKYSEEDLLSAFEAGMMFIGKDKGSFREWFSQFKK